MAANNSSVVNLRLGGQCMHCLGILSFETAGLLHRQGPGCSGSGQPPVTSVCRCVSHMDHSHQRLALLLLPSSDASRHHRSVTSLPSSRPEARSYGASRMPAAEKLSESPRQIVSDPDCVDSWISLSITFTCFGLPGQRGGHRHFKQP